MKRRHLAAWLMLAAMTFMGACSTMKQESTAAASGLDGSAWTMSMPPGAATDVKELPTMKFEAGRVSGSDGCNRFSAPYAQPAAGRLQIGSPRVGTMMACPTEGGAKTASVFNDTLTATRAYRIDAGKLVLLDTAGAQMLRFDPQATSLAGTSWRVGSYNNGKRAVVSVATGTKLTLAFFSDGKVSGFGGCNNFSGSYRADDGTLNIGSLAATRKACATPEGVMVQETAFLRALETATMAQREDDRLELHTAGGAMAAKLRLDTAAAKP